MKKLTWVFMIVFCFVPAALFAQTKDQMQVIHEAAKANKKLVVSENLQLTDEEAKAFWPLYGDYQKALNKINERTGKLIQDYANNYNVLSDEMATNLLDKLMEIQKDRLKLQTSYIPKFRLVLQAKKVVRYFQIENKLRAIMQYELARGIPFAK
jgi:hypothetical protein